MTSKESLASQHGNYLLIKADVTDLMSQTGNFLADLTAEPSEVLGQQLNKSFESFKSTKKKLENETIDCALMALTKSGKSTLINAHCGSKLMPSNNVPETAMITSVEHQSSGPPTLQYTAGGELIRVEGEDNIYDYLQYLNSEVRGRAHRKEDEQMLRVKVEIAALQDGQGGCDSQKVRLRLLDTPGTNEAGEDRLRHSVERLLDSVDAVVFLMDYNKLKTSEEATMLAKLKEKNPQLVNRLAQRLFFVVNKVDCIQTSTGQEEEELREYVAELITSQMNSESFHLKPQQVMLVSAHEALLARLVLKGKASEEDRKKFAHKVWGSSFARGKRSKSEAEYMEQAATMLEDSRLPELEENLLSYLYKNAGGIKLMSQLDSITQLLIEIRNVAVTGKAALQQSAGQLMKESSELQQNLQSTLDRFAVVQRDADLVEANVIDNVQFRMQHLKERLFEHVVEVLDGVEQPRLPAVKAGPWKKIWEKSVKFITRSSGEDNRTETHLRELLQDLHQDINNQIEAEVQEFWHDLEISTNEKHQELVRVINGHLDRLARDIEDVVGKSLDLKLDPVDIHMKPPTAQEFHNSIQGLFTAGISKSTQTHKEMNEEEYVVWERKFRGLCKQSEYYVGRPAKKQVEIEKQVTTYHFQPEKIKEYFTNTVNNTIDTSIKYVRAYVHAYMSDNIEVARLKISGYGEQYAEIMQAALKTKSQSVEEQQSGLDSLEAHLQEVSRLLQASSFIQQRAGQLFPATSEPATCALPLQVEGPDVGESSTTVKESSPPVDQSGTEPLNRGVPLPVECFSQPEMESEDSFLAAVSSPSSRDVDRDMLEEFLSLHRPMEAAEGHHQAGIGKEEIQTTRTPTPAEEVAPYAAPQREMPAKKTPLPTYLVDESDDTWFPNARAMEGGRYTCPGPEGSHQQENAQATTSTNPFELIHPSMNPFNFLSQEASGTHIDEEHVRDESPITPPPREPIQQPSTDAEVQVVRVPTPTPTLSPAPQLALGSVQSQGADETPLPLSDRRKSMDPTEVYSTSSVASASASPMHASAVLPEDAQQQAEDVSGSAILRSESNDSEWECVDDEGHTADV